MTQKFLFHKGPNYSNPIRVFLLLGFILVGLFIIRGYQHKEIKPLFEPTLTPTRTSNSFALEGQTHFQAGDLKSAIAAYQKALQTDPNNAQLWSDLARIQTYSSNSLSNAEDQRSRMREALQSADQAVKLAPDDSSAHAVRAFVLDWLAAVTDKKSDQESLFSQAYQESQQAYVKDKTNVLALAYSAEILNDQQKWDQAQQYMQLAMERGSNLMDTWRIQASIYESLGNYKGAIDAYEKAVSINPNLTFLYIRIGVIYRYLKQYDEALSYFARAVALNKQLGIEEPIPYIAIGKVYTQEGEFFVASLNMKKALQIDPYRPDLYAELGMVYWHARNYESAIPALKCAVKGCTQVESCAVRDCDPAKDPAIAIQGIPLEANDLTTALYYYTYGSVLAGMYRPVGTTKDYCTESLDVLAQVRTFYSEDPAIMNIVDASQAICASFGITKGGASSQPVNQPTSTPGPVSVTGQRVTSTPTR